MCGGTGGGISAFTKHCGWWRWRKTCDWKAARLTPEEEARYQQSYDEWFDNYPFEPHPKRESYCVTCGKRIWH